jgi:protein MpaA
VKFQKLPPGKSVQNREIPSFISETKSDKYIYVLGAVHGDEIEGAHLAINLLKWLEEQNEIEMPIVFVPIVNVDGYHNNSRVNGNGIPLPEKINIFLELTLYLNLKIFIW